MTTDREDLLRRAEYKAERLESLARALNNSAEKKERLQSAADLRALVGMVRDHIPDAGKRIATAVDGKAVERLRKRRDTWSLNDDSARVTVRLGDLRAALDLLTSLSGNSSNPRPMGRGD